MLWKKRYLPRTRENVEIAKTIFVPGDGPLPTSLFGLGQSPGFGEAMASPPGPFQSSAPAGGELDMYLQQVNLPRHEWFLSNCFKYFIADAFGSDRPPTQTELESGWEDLSVELAACEPKVIACFGAVATRWMMKKAGLEYHSADCHRGMPVGYYGDALLFSTHHPAAGIHSPDSMRLVMADFYNLSSTVRQINRGDRISLPTDPYADCTDYRRLYSTADIDEVWEESAPFISIDTEGTRKRPIMLQFSFSEGTGYAIYAEDAELIACFHHKLREFVAAHAPDYCIILHNALYDIGVMSTMDIHLPDGSFIDSMVMAFLLGTEPLGLKPLAFRLCGMKMQSYEEQIGPKNEEMALDYLIAASQYEWPAAQEMVVRDGPDYRLYRPQSIGVRIAKILKDWAEQEVKTEHVTHVEMEETNKKGETKIKRHTHDHFVKHRGHCPPGCHEVKVEREKPVDIRDRWYKKGESIEGGDGYDGEFETTGVMLRAPVEKKLGRMKSATLLDIPESQALAYANRDADATTRVGPLLLSRITDMGLTSAMKIDMGIIPLLARCMEIGLPANREHFIQFGKRRRERMDQIEYEIYKLVGHSINLASGPQLSALLFGELRLPSNRWTKSREQLAVDKKALEPLRYMHPIIPLILEWAESETLLHNYAEVLPAKMDADGWVHCKIGLTRVPSGRLNTSDPNLMAQPTRSDLGKEIRDGFIAPAGYKYVCGDLKQIELKVSADESQDKVLMNVFLTGIDGHTDTAQRIFGMEKPSDVQRSVGKTINFLIVNRGGGQALMEQLMLQKLAAQDWQPGVRYIEGAVLQNAKGECHRFKALTEGISGRVEPKWNWSDGGTTRDGDILFQEIGSSWTKDICDQYIAKWYVDHPGVNDWHESLFAEALRFGFIRNWSGRIRYSPEIRSSIQRIQEQGKKQCVNFPIQSGAQDIMKIVMALMWKEMRSGRLKSMKVEPMLQIHDDLVSLVEDAGVADYCAVFEDVAGRVTGEYMETEYGKKFTVPLGADCKVGQSWGGVKKYKV